MFYDLSFELNSDYLLAQLFILYYIMEWEEKSQKSKAFCLLYISFVTLSVSDHEGNTEGVN